MARLSGTQARDTLRGSREDDQIFGLGGDDVLSGRAGDDLIQGGSGRDRILGQRGADRLFGGGGDDQISGGPGADRLSGGPGVDALTGGPGADQFVYRSAAEGIDRITDFDPDHGDALRLIGALRGASVRMVDDGASTTVSVRTTDADGFTDLVVLEGYRQPIDVWYGDHQQFGDPGEAQRWVNVLGTVAPAGLSSLSYTLNGGPEQALLVGPDDRRLHGDGDFNIELDYAQLNPTAVDDHVTIRATYGNGEVFTHDVTLDYEGGHQWPTTYSIDWGNVTHLQDVVQVVEGLWSFDDSGVRPAEQGYDRVLAIGDASWDSYEVRLSIEMHDLHTVDPRGRDGGGILLGLQWNGHTSDPAGGSPHIGWIPSGAFAFLGNQVDRVTHVELHPTEWFADRNNDGIIDLNPVINQGLQLLEGHTYNFLIRNESVAADTDLSDGLDRTYSLRVWEQGTAEPETFLIHQTMVDQTPTGGIYLNAHYFDVTFGDISVTPLPGNELLETQNGLSTLLAMGAADAHAFASTGATTSGAHEPVGPSQNLTALVVSGDDTAVAA